MMTTKKTDSPLSRWSHRKLLVQEGKLPIEAAALSSAPEPDPPSAAPDDLGDNPDEKNLEPQTSSHSESESDAENFADVDFEALDYDSDYTRFMANNVPEMVKRRALRALWNSDPVFANLDGLNDYDEDFTDAAVITKGIESAWNVGKGYMTAKEEEQLESDQEVETATPDDGQENGQENGEDDAIAEIVDDQNQLDKLDRDEQGERPVAVSIDAKTQANLVVKPLKTS